MADTGVGETGESSTVSPVVASKDDSPVEEIRSTEPSPQHGVQVPSASTADQASAKIDILLKATGNAPILTNKKWTVEKLRKISSINVFVRKLLKCEPQETLFLYVNQSFAPSPDVDVGTLYECFGANGKLILHYCLTQAWG